MKLGDIIQLHYGKSLPSRDRNDGKVPVYGSGGITGYHDEALINGPGIIVGRKGSIGTIYFEEKNFFPIDTVFYVEHDKDKVDQEYLYFYLKEMNLENMNTDAAVPGLNRDVALSQEVSIPDLRVQKRIASILSAFDDLIENNTRRIDILEEMARRIYREWFVHFRYPGHEEDKLVDSGTELGEIPEGWEVLKFDDILTKLESGNRPKGGVSQYKDGIPSVGAENVLGVGQYDYSKEKYVPEEFYEEMNKGIVEDYDVLLYKDGASLGRVSIFGDGFPHRKLCINSHAYLIRAEETCSQTYLYFWVDSPMIKSTIRNANTNAAQPGINMGDVRGFPFLLPSDRVLKEFDGIGEPIISEIFHLAKMNQNLKETRDLLLPKLISGKIDVGNLPLTKHNSHV